MSGELVVTGREEVVAGFEELERFIGDMTEPHRRVLGPLIPEVAARTPVRTGRLASSWHLEASSTAGSIESGLVYAGPLEFGSSSRGIEAERMVRDTLHSNERDIVEGYERELAEKARRIGFRVDT